MRGQAEIWTADRFPQLNELAHNPRSALILDPASVATEINWQNLPINWDRLVVVGSQGGDEGKGTWVNRIAHNWFLQGVEDPVIARFNGGAGSGHEFIPAGTRSELVHHILPAATDPNAISVVGRGVFVRPEVVLKEINDLQQMGLQPKAIMIDGAATLSWGAHVERDIAEEKWRAEKTGRKISTTQSGIGPTGADYWGRNGLNINALLLSDDKLAIVVEQEVERQNGLLAAAGSPLSYEEEDVFHQFKQWGAELRPYIQNTFAVVRQAARYGNFEGEGAQGFRIGRQTGYPGSTTSSDTNEWPLRARYKLGPLSTVGVIKLVPTVVGTHVVQSGPGSDVQETLYNLTAQRGSPEKGRKTGRLRNFYYLSIPELRAAAATFGIGAWAVSKVDVCDPLEKIYFGMEYVFPDGTRTTDYDPEDPRMTDPDTTMNLLELDGWKRSTAGMNDYNDSPRELRTVLDTLFNLTGVPVAAFGTGPNFEEAVYAQGSPFNR